MPRPDRDALDRMYLDSRSYLETTVSSIADLDDKSSRILRINILLLGLFSSIAALTVQNATPQPSSFPTASALFLIGTVLLAFSTVLAIISFLKKDISGGVTNLSRHLGTAFTEEDYLERAVEAFERAGDRNRRLLESAAFWFQKALGALTAAIGTLLRPVLAATMGAPFGWLGLGISLVFGYGVTTKEFEEER